MRWDEKKRQLTLPNGGVLDVTLRGPLSRVQWVADVEGESEVLELRGSTADEAIEVAIHHSIATPEHVWIPHLAPEEGNVIGDAVFRSPAILIADATIALAFIPDLDDVREVHVAAAGSGLRTWLDYDHPRSTLTLAVGSYREEGHVFYVREQPSQAASSSQPPMQLRLRMHVVASTSEADKKNPYGMVARWMWKRWGHAGHRAAAETKQPIERLMNHVVRWAFSSNEGWGDSVWQPIHLTLAQNPNGKGEIGAAAPVFIVDVTRHPSVPLAERQWREPRSIWNQAWFSTQRCANGLLRYARQIASSDLEDRAHKMTEVALAAPQRDGLFPAVLIANNDDYAASTGEAWRWLNSNRRPPSASEDACHIVDAAFTCRMLLEWHALTADDARANENRARAYVQRFADRLVALQRPSGAFPGWVEPDGSVPAELAESPETAVSTALLFELAAAVVDDHPKAADAYTRAALASLPFLTSVTRDGRWEDFETYYSCAPWGGRELLGKRVPRNGVYKQNTLSIAWCAHAFLAASRRSRSGHVDSQQRQELLDLARRCIDELSLYQAVWDPPWLPAPAHGGFGVMNADCEWNDARQSLFAPLYLDLGRETGDRELIERGVSAVRASFSMLYCPENPALARAYEKRFPFFGPESYGFMMENQGHSGVDNPIGTFTIFTWGNGSALATAAMVRDRFPEVIEECGLDLE